VFLMKQADNKQTLLDVGEVAEILKVPRSWIYGRVHSNNLPFPHLKVGTYLRFRVEDIEAFIEKQLVSKNR